MIPPPRDDRKARAGVVLLHGFAAFPGVMWPLAWRLRRLGFATLTPYYPSWARALDAHPATLQPQINRFTSHVEGPLHFVGHSMGGLIIRALLREQRPPSLGRVVLLGTPNAGSEIADVLHTHPLARHVLGRAGPLLVTARDDGWRKRLGRVDYPLGVIAGDRCARLAPFAHALPLPHDGKVSVAATHVEGESDHLVLPLTHSGLCFDPRIVRPLVRFLETGSFAQG